MIIEIVKPVRKISGPGKEGRLGFRSIKKHEKKSSEVLTHELFSCNIKAREEVQNGRTKIFT